MNGDFVKRIVALTRQKKSYNAMVKTGDLRQSEADELIGICDREIERLRAQGVLIEGANHLAPGVTPPKGSKSS